MKANESGREVNTKQSYENALIQDRTAVVGRAVLFITEMFHCASHEKKGLQTDLHYLQCNLGSMPCSYVRGYDHFAGTCGMHI
jgi:hypothetical protein